ncbi:MAG: lipocalin family protein [Paludibacteraceae bacterium]|nr:lipocalin family protein [Paludibacteraceae bacterium]
MKKLFQFAIMAAIVLPMMMSCKTNDPDNPNKPENQTGTEEWFEKWTEGNPEDAVKINEENLIGIWRFAAMATIHKDSVAPVGAYDYSKEDSGSGYYLELNGDKSYTYYDYYSYDGLVKEQGKWAITGDKIAFSREVSHAVWWSPEGEYTINLLEESRLVLCRPNDYDSLLNEYTIYTRINELPDLPKTNEEHLAQYPWKIVSDTVITIETQGKYNGNGAFVADYDANGEAVEKVIDTQVNLLKNYTLRFFEDSTFLMKTAGGQIYAECRWYMRQDLGNYALLSLYQVEDNGNETNIEIPNFCDDLGLTFDLKDPTKAILDHTETLPKEDNYTQKRKVYTFHIEAVK